MSSLAPSRAGRSPYNSEPSIEAPDSTTTLRRIGGETPAITHHPHQQAIAGCASRPPSQAAGGPAAPTVPGTPKRSGQGVCASVEAGVIACGHGHLPKSPDEIRVKSGLGHAFRPLSRSFRAAGGSRAAHHVNRSLAFRRHLRSRSVKTCNYGRFTRIRHGAKPE